MLREKLRTAFAASRAAQMATIVFAALVAVAFFISFLPSYQECRTEQYKRHAREDAGDNTTRTFGFRVFLRCENRVIERHEAFFVVVFTALLFGSTATLWLATERLVRGADRNAERQLRAYITVKTGSVHLQNNATGMKFEVNPLLINTGQTPAYSLTYSARVALVPHPNHAGFDYRTPMGTNPSKSTIGPGQEHTMYVVADRMMSDAELALIALGPVPGLKLGVFGVVNYVDAFDEPRSTEFSWTILFPRQPGNPLWIFTEHHNQSN